MGLAHADSTAFAPGPQLMLFEVSSLHPPSYWKEDLACCGSYHLDLTNSSHLGWPWDIPSSSLHSPAQDNLLCTPDPHTASVQLC